MIYARFNATDYKLEQRPVLSFSASETTFSEIVIDFTGKTADDLPIKYQEIQIVDTGTPDVVLYYGYCSQPSLPLFDGTIERVLLTIELMSPQTYLTKRTIDITIENETINDAIEDILASIVSNDGFTIEYNDLPTTEYLSGVFRFRTIESLLSELAGRFGFIWYVDELKKIYLKDLSAIETALPVYSLTSDTQQYLKSVQPSFSVADYANRLNFTNVNLVSQQDLIVPGITLNTGETYSFIYPFSLSEGVVLRIPPWSGNPAINMIFKILTGGADDIYVVRATKQIVVGDLIGFLGDDETDKLIMLIRDSTNANLITGFKWVAPFSEAIVECIAGTALRPATMSYVDPIEIANNVGKLNTSGIVEKEYNANGKYYTYDELTAYAKTLLRQNNKQADTVDLTFRGDDLSALKALLMPTAKVYIDLPNQFILGSDYVVVSSEFMIDNGKHNLSVNTRRANLNENYVDIFRRESSEETTEQGQYITYYNQDEKTVISHKVLVDGVEVDV